MKSVRKYFLAAAAGMAVVFGAAHIMAPEEKKPETGAAAASDNAPQRNPFAPATPENLQPQGYKELPPAMKGYVDFEASLRDMPQEERNTLLVRHASDPLDLSYFHAVLLTGIPDGKVLHMAMQEALGDPTAASKPNWDAVYLVLQSTNLFSLDPMDKDACEALLLGAAVARKEHAELARLLTEFHLNANAGNGKPFFDAIVISDRKMINLMADNGAQFTEDLIKKFAHTLTAEDEVKRDLYAKAQRMRMSETGETPPQGLTLSVR